MAMMKYLVIIVCAQAWLSNFSEFVMGWQLHFLYCVQFLLEMLW